MVILVPSLGVNMITYIGDLLKPQWLKKSLCGVMRQELQTLPKVETEEEYKKGQAETCSQRPEEGHDRAKEDLTLTCWNMN